MGIRSYFLSSLVFSIFSIHVQHVQGLRGLSQEQMMDHYFELFMSRYECGKIKVQPSIGGRIIGGSEPFPGEAPWIAILGYMDVDALSSYGAEDLSIVTCAGTLITDVYVLTAAHCVIGPYLRSTPYEVRLGVYNLFDKAHIQRYPIKRIWSHPDYVYKVMINDIALLRLEGPVKFTDYVRPVCLPLAKYETYDFAYVKATVLGWGITDMDVPHTTSTSQSLMKLEQMVWPTGKCMWYNYASPHPPSQICFGGNPGKDTCNGDDGGPLLWQESATHRHFLIGLVSPVGNVCARGKPAIFTRITSFLPWLKTLILEDIEDNGGCYSCT